eukprot:937932-Prymnesium_polylepis.1
MPLGRSPPRLHLGTGLAPSNATWPYAIDVVPPVSATPPSSPLPSFLRRDTERYFLAASLASLSASSMPKPLR